MEKEMQLLKDVHAQYHQLLQLYASPPPEPAPVGALKYQIRDINVWTAAATSVASLGWCMFRGWALIRMRYAPYSREQLQWRERFLSLDTKLLSLDTKQAPLYSELLAPGLFHTNASAAFGSASLTPSVNFFFTINRNTKLAGREYLFWKGRCNGNPKGWFTNSLSSSFLW
jgi:hypothetical protein